MEAVRTENLTKSYGKNRGICGVDLAVETGDFFGFIGPNGAGKSTTIRILLGFISADKGSARLLGKDVLVHRKEILSDIGYLPSETAFYGNMKVRDVLKFSADLRKKDCSKEAEVLCERLGLDPTRKVEQLSLGNRKKVGIVCAMQHKPALYIMDEPTSGLDPLIQREFYSLLTERNNEGATVFLSSHVLSEIQRYCKHAAIIRNGQILISDSVDKLGASDAKRVKVSGVTEMAGLENIRDVSKTENGMSFLYSGSASVLLAALSRLPVTDIEISEPDLEEVFLHYYSEGEK